jgi:superfamily II DNA or RNA helicase
MYVVHRIVLLKQVIESIEQFVPEAKIGIVHQDTDTSSGADIVVGMLQSLLMHKNYSSSAYNGFGLVIIDEVHHICSSVFSDLLPMFSAKYRIGLTATPERTDGLGKILPLTVGPLYDYRKDDFKTITKTENQSRLVVMYKLNYDGTKLKDDFERCPLCLVPKGHRKMAARSVMAKRILFFQQRCAFVEKLLMNLYEDCNKGRAILVLCDRVKSVLDLFRKLCQRKQEAKNDSVAYYGKLDKSVLKNKRVIITTYQKSGEGLDIPWLDTLLVAAPRSIEQPLGRIEREFAEKQPLLVYDVWDDLDPFVNSGWQRTRVYKSHNFEVIIKTKKLLQKKI